VAACLVLTLLAQAQRAFGALDWSAGPWGVVIESNGTPGSVFCPVDYPGGTKTGNALAVYYQLQPTNVPQLWVFLTDGFWRQTSAESQFLTSYRLFRYFSSGDQNCDRLAAVGFRVLGTNDAGELEIETAYSNNATAGDQFRVTGTIVLEKPDALQSGMRAEITVSNASGRAVTPFWQGHRDLAEQWEVFGVSSMYVADNLTGGLPAWYNALDPAHHYVGVTNDASYLNDGYSVNGAIYVSAHDAKYIVASNATVALNHDTNLCPVVIVPDYEWYSELVMRRQVASELLVQHAYRSARNHRVQVTACSGLTSIATNLKWAATYYREDTNMVDGDNVQVKLGMDDFLNAWPADAVQRISLRLRTGDSPPAITSLSVAPAGNVTIGWTTEPGERYALDYAAVLGGTWSNVTANAAGPILGPLSVSPGFLRIVETNAP
jgi:hypothetical protein